VQSIGRAKQHIRERAQPAQHSLYLPADNDAQAVLLNQIGHPRVIRRRQGVLHRFGNQSLSLKPYAGAAVQASHRFRWHPARQPVPQHIGKQVMIAIPVAVIVQRHDKQVGALKLLQNELAICL
jgi:hypothetical protein